MSTPKYKNPILPHLKKEGSYIADVCGNPFAPKPPCNTDCDVISLKGEGQICRIELLQGEEIFQATPK